MSVDQAAQEAQPFRHVIPILADVVLGRGFVDSEKFDHAHGFGKEIRGMAELRCLDNYRPLQIENVFRPEQINVASALAELPVVEDVVVRLPSNERNIEVYGNT
jgi:hypothetical protein